MRYLLLIVLLILIRFETEASCLCKLKDDVKSNFEYADIIFTGKVLDRTPLRVWRRDTTNVKAEYLAALGNRPFKTSEFNYYKKVNYSIVREIEYTFEVTKFYKGKARKKLVKIRSGADIDCCGFQFKVGQEYLVYGRDEARRYLKRNQLDRYKELKGTYETSICTLTTNLEKAAGQIAELKKL